jgi:uncharacterized membrane protein (UPF0127 family)
MVRLCAIAVGLALAACSPNGSAAQETAARPTDTPTAPGYSEAGLRLIDVTIVSGDTRHSFVTELAATNDEQARGMMFRTEMGDDEGMLFPSYVPQARSFWMKNTALPLDIIFVGPDYRITNIGEGVPYSTASVPSDGPSIAVFEIRGGLSEELGIGPGDLVQFELPEGVAP